ncbi:4'-phosphopantetheinyl transferase family protein [Hahella ganghwensis]|uniref:4'-phosphopantetheinyl transferase family protein n=1 Tax=Hahella ganghwensis TaxID=286420 RepID=UPI00037A2796|nr:4'-phosphopantetheinyl transferase superfamily protein [Hahella ganghwensis]
MCKQNHPFLLKENHSFTHDNQIQTVHIHYDRTQFSDELFEHFNILQPKELNRSVIQRKSEFLAGRYAASKALNALGVPHSPLGIGQHRNPIWPSPVIGSITHTQEVAICSASKQPAMEFLGIDMEYWFSEDQVMALKASIINLDEERLLRHESIPFEKAVTIAFSAKESLFKALYPRVRSYFGFSAARLTELNPTESRFTLILNEDLPGDIYRKGNRVNGYFCLSDRWVETMVTGPLVRS